MKFSKLKQIVTEYANQCKEDAAYSGSWGDGGCSAILQELETYKNKLVFELDLRPSEFSKLNSIEVGEPTEFRIMIKSFKHKLSEKIIL